MSSENLTTFTKVDPGGFLTVTPTRLTGTVVPNTTDCYLYKDFGVNYFSDFEVRCTVNCAAAVRVGINTQIGVFSACDTFGSFPDEEATSVQVWFEYNGAVLRLGLSEGTVVADTCDLLAFGTTYYLIIRKIWHYVTVEIWTDAAHTTLLDIMYNGASTAGSKRYMVLGASKDALGASTITAYVEDVIVQWPEETLAVSFGDMGGGNHTGGGWSPQFFMAKWTAPESGHIYEMGFFIDLTTRPINFKGVVFSDNAGVPNAKLTEGPILTWNPPVVNSGYVFVPMDFDVVAGQVLWFGLYMDNTTFWYTENGAVNQQYQWSQGAWPVVPSPYAPAFGPTVLNEEGIQVFYDRAGGGKGASNSWWDMLFG